MTAKRNSAERLFEADTSVIALAKAAQGNIDILQNINVDRILFLYSNIPATVGNSFALGSVVLPSTLEKSLHPTYDYIMTIFEPVWTKLPVEHQVIQMEQLLNAVAFMNMEKRDGPKLIECMELLKHVGSQRMIQSSKLVNKLLKELCTNYLIKSG